MKVNAREAAFIGSHCNGRERPHLSKIDHTSSQQHKVGQTQPVKRIWPEETLVGSCETDARDSPPVHPRWFPWGLSNVIRLLPQR